MDSLSFSSSGSTAPNLVEGFVACGIAVIGFGSNFVPVKKIYSGNGIFTRIQTPSHALSLSCVCVCVCVCVYVYDLCSYLCMNVFILCVDGRCVSQFGW